MKKILAYLALLQLSFFAFPESLPAVLQETQASWDGRDFYVCDLSNAAPGERVIEEPTIYFAGNHLFCYGHALLDSVIPLYAILKEHQLLNAPINLVIPSNAQLQSNPTFCNIVQLIKDIFRFKNVIIANKDNALQDHYYFKRLLVTDHVPFAHARDKFTFFAFYRAFPESFQYIYTLKAYGMQDNIVFRDPNPGDNITKSFIDFVLKAYKIDLPMIKNRVLITERRGSRLIKNIDEISASLSNNGYTVVRVDFEKLPIKQQIIETIQSEYLIGTYGSNLVNAMFLKPGSNVVILWHKYAKYFWSRRYCVIHSAFLSAGVQLIEFDKPDYDTRDTYTEPVHVKEYFYRKHRKNIIILKPDKANMDAMIKYPLDAMYEITNVDLYIDANQLLTLMRNVQQ